MRSFDRLWRNAPYGICRTSPDGRFLQVNPALQKMLGYSSAEALAGKNLRNDVFEHAPEFECLARLLGETEEITDIEMGVEEAGWDANFRPVFGPPRRRRK